MNEMEKTLRAAVVDSRTPSQPLKNEKNSVPGQQMGLYSDNREKDVCQMTATLNNPGEDSQNERG